MNGGSADRVDAAWLEYQRAMNELRAPDLSAIPGLTEAERRAALELLASSHQVDLEERGRKVAALAYLAKNAPGMSITEAIGSLSIAQLQEYQRILTGEDES